MTGPMLRLRDYQADTVSAVVRDWQAGHRRVAAVLPTGAGKTVVFAHLIRMVVDAGGRAIVLAHRDELIEQAAGKIRDVAPETVVGIVKGPRREVLGRSVVVASVQSLRTAQRRAELAEWRPTLVVVDETHHIVAGTYLDILKDLGCMSPDGPLVLGVTATLGRSDRVSIGEVLEKVSHVVKIQDLIRRGFLVMPRGIRVRVEGLDLGKVRRTAGDWAGGALGRAMSDLMAPEAILRAIREHAGDRQGICFAPSVAFAHEAAEKARAAGIQAHAVDGMTDPDVRRDILRRFRNGEVRLLWNCGVFTEGTDLPMASLVVIARPTSSAGLYVQMAGRGLRTHPGKVDCLLMDVVGVSGRHRLAGMVDLGGGDIADRLTPEEREELAQQAEELGLDLLGVLGRAEGGAGAPEPETVDGRLVAEEVDLFGKSIHRWLRTRRGVWFLEAGGILIALAPEGDKWSVCQMPLSSAGGKWITRGLDLSYAMAWGEQALKDAAVSAGVGFGVTRKAGWRSRPATRAQMDMLARLGWKERVETSGEASDGIAVCLASSRVDHLPLFAGVSRDD